MQIPQVQDSTKAHSDLHNYFILHTTLNVIGSIFFVQKMKRKKFDENKFNERFEWCSVVLHQTTQ